MSFRGGLDLEGRIVIKVQLGNDVRKILIHNDEITYDELALMMQRIYKGSVKQDDELTIKYKDEDGDLITIFDSSDVSFAIQTCNRQLKLVIYVNGLERNFDDAEVATIRKGLRDVRDMVNGLLDQIDAKTPRSDRLDASADDVDEVSSQEDQPSLVNSGSMAMHHPTVDSKEFDPLNTSLSATAQLDSVGGGDKSASQSQYGGSQYGEQVAKSFDQMSMSDRQSNHSPIPAAVQNSFGSTTGYGANAAQQNLGSQQAPVSTGQPGSAFFGQTPVSTTQLGSAFSGQAPVSTTQLGSAFSGQAPAMSLSSGYYSHAQATSQYANTQMSASGIPPQQNQQQQQQQSQLPQQQQQQPTQQYNYAQQQNPQQQSQQLQSMPPTQLPPNPQQMSSQQTQYGGYSGMTSQPPQPSIYGQQQQQQQQSMPPSSSYAGGSPNPYSKPGQIRGSYPRATGAYPQLPQAGQQRPSYPPPQQ